MSAEHQQLEWKESWRDEHLKWVCAFANGEGGTLVIGRNDQGEVVGLRNARAAVLLFHPDPLGFVTGAFVKVGFFRSDSDLAYHDEIVGDLFLQVQQTQDLLFTKYLKAAISYEGILRVERFPVPREAMREALLNAVVHRDYAVPAPLQIRVYDERLVLVNPAVLPDGWTQASLLAPHYSQPHNPDIANAFFRAGEIEAWGRGIQRIFDACRVAKAPAPVVRFEANGLWVEFPFSADYLALIRGAPVRTQVEAPVETRVETPVEALAKTPSRILALLRRQPAATLHEVATALGLSTSAVERAARRLQEEGRLRRVGPKKGGRWEVLQCPIDPVPSAPRRTAPSAP